MVLTGLYKNSLILFLMMAMFACTDKSTTGTKDPETPTKPTVIKGPEFNADSAYVLIEKQLAFGPRIPNSTGHLKCSQWLEEQFKLRGAKVIVQQADVKAWDGTIFKIRNIIASFNPDKQPRLLISAHWDSRPYADKDKEKPKDPVPAANDAGSGVAVILEMARLIQSSPLENAGVDFILWDAEDYGNYEITESWGLGSIYWAKHKHDPSYFPKYGINLDMVGAKDATFFFEGHTMRVASGHATNLWNTASSLGYGKYFLQHSEEYGVLDDHYNVIQYAGIPMVEIIDRKMEDGSFFEHWHTTHDDMDAISKETLKAVGQTVTSVLYSLK